VCFQLTVVKKSFEPCRGWRDPSHEKPTFGLVGPNRSIDSVDSVDRSQRSRRPAIVVFSRNTPKPRPHNDRPTFASGLPLLFPADTAQRKGKDGARRLFSVLFVVLSPKRGSYTCQAVSTHKACPTSAKQQRKRAVVCRRLRGSRGLVPRRSCRSTFSEIDLLSFSPRLCTLSLLLLKSKQASKQTNKVRAGTRVQKGPFESRALARPNPSFRQRSPRPIVSLTHSLSHSLTRTLLSVSSRCAASTCTTTPNPHNS
jgi:hypothetical protein